MASPPGSPDPGSGSPSPSYMRRRAITSFHRMSSTEKQLLGEKAEESLAKLKMEEKAKQEEQTKRTEERSLKVREKITQQYKNRHLTLRNTSSSKETQKENAVEMNNKVDDSVVAKEEVQTVRNF